MNSVGHASFVHTSNIYSHSSISYHVFCDYLRFLFAHINAYFFHYLYCIGLISPTGLVPPLTVIWPLGAYFLKNASAIWLLPAFSTHTNRTVFSSSPPLFTSASFLDLPNNSFMSRYHSLTQSLTAFIIRLEIFLLLSLSLYLPPCSSSMYALSSKTSTFLNPAFLILSR